MKKMLINAIHTEEVRVVVVEDNLLKELYIESSLKEQLRGNIYKSRITKVEQSLNAAFVDYGREKNGFLPINDINPAFIPGAKTAKDIPGLLKKGMELMVQVSREEKSAKGALLTMNISIPGRYMVLVPRQDLSGISRKIADDEKRKRLKDIMKQLDPPSDMGLIVRTAGMDKNKTELSKDMNYLFRLWKSIEDDYASAAAPGLIYKEGDIVIRSIRDYFTTDISEILIDDEETQKRAAIFFKSLMPRHKKLVKLYKSSKPLFNKYELEQQIQGIYKNKVNLISGGSIIIEQTEAMVVIDVNSGHSTGSKDIEQTAFFTNMEAAKEIARQLILRDLGGLVVIDFIDMRTRDHMRKVEKAIKEGLKSDKAHIQLGRISKFGIMELSRERLSPPLLEKSHVICPTCEGSGLIRSVESASLMALREIHAYINRTRPAKIRVILPHDTAMHLLNRQKQHIIRLEQDYSTDISIYSNHGLKQGQISFENPDEITPE